METVDGGDDGSFEEELSLTPLRHARAPLYAGLNALQVAASAISTAEPRFAMAALDSALSYLRDTLLPACRAEEATIFVAIDSMFGVANSCHVMKAQHTTLLRMAGDLAQAVDAAKSAGSVDDVERYLTPLLHGLYAFARGHIESEDEAYVTLLEAMLSANQAESLAASYEAALEPLAGA